MTTAIKNDEHVNWGGFATYDEAVKDSKDKVILSRTGYVDFTPSMLCYSRCNGWDGISDTCDCGEHKVLWWGNVTHYGDWSVMARGIKLIESNCK